MNGLKVKEKNPKLQHLMILLYLIKSLLKQNNIILILHKFKWNLLQLKIIKIIPILIRANELNLIQVTLLPKKILALDHKIMKVIKIMKSIAKLRIC